METTNRPAAALLAGGVARRRGGRSKATLELAGIRVIQRQLEVLRRVDPVFVVGGAPAQFAPHDLSAIPDALSVIPDARPRCGALEARPEELSVVESDQETVSAFDPDGLLFVNLNTPHDYERARELLASKVRRDRIMDGPEPGG